MPLYVYAQMRQAGQHKKAACSVGTPKSPYSHFPYYRIIGVHSTYLNGPPEGLQARRDNGATLDPLMTTTHGLRAMVFAHFWCAVASVAVLELKIFIGDGSLQPLHFTVHDDAVRASERFCEAFNVGYEDCKNIEIQIVNTQRASSSVVR